MNITGNQIKQAIKMKGLELDSVSSTFDDSLFKFEDETKMSPVSIAEVIYNLESDIAKLQAAQKFYNTNTKITFEDKTINLQEAINLVGGAGRISKLWRTAAKGEKKDRWDRGSAKTRNKTEEVAVPTITKEEALILFKAAEKRASQLRNAIAESNILEVEISFIYESLFD